MNHLKVLSTITKLSPDIVESQVLTVPAVVTNIDKNEIANKSSLLKFWPRPHVSGYFLIRNFFFPDTAIVHTRTANSQANPEIF